MADLGSAPPIGVVLRQLREKRRLTQEALASLARVHPNYIGGVERGERNPTFRSVARILGALGVTWRELGEALDSTETR